MQGPRLTHLWGPPLPLLRGKNRKALINLRKAENDDIDALKVRSIKIYKSLLEFPTIPVLNCCLRRKSVQRHEIVEIVVGWQEQDYTGKPTKNATVETFHETHGLYFL